MAIKTEKLTHTFLSKHSDSAARVLERLDPAEVAALFTELPTRIVLPVIRTMLPSHAGKILLYLDADRQVAIINELDARLTANAIRSWPQDNRTSLLRLLPKRLSVSVRLLLNYPAGSVGSLMDTDIVTAHMNQTLSEIEELFRKAKAEYQAEIYIVDDKLKFKGALSIMRVLRDDGQKKARQVMDQKIPTVLATSHMSYVTGHIAWESRSSLPVVDRENHIIGLLQHAMLIDKSKAPDADDSNYHHLVSEVLEAYWAGWKAIFSLVVSNSDLMKRF